MSHTSLDIFPTYKNKSMLLAHTKLNHGTDKNNYKYVAKKEKCLKTKNVTNRKYMSQKQKLCQRDKNQHKTNKPICHSDTKQFSHQKQEHTKQSLNITTDKEEMKAIKWQLLVQTTIQHRSHRDTTCREEPP
jgi:hypothetical protein